MTQAELAQAVGTSSCAISRIESGRRQPGLATVHAMCDALGLELHMTTREERA